MEEENFNQPTEKRRSSKLIILIVILTILVAGAFGWYFFILEKNSESDTSSSQDLNTNSEVEQLTYTSEDYGYLLKYPSDWEYTDDAEGNPAMFYDPTGLAQIIEGTELLQGTKMEIYVSEDIEMTLDEMVKERDIEFEILSEEEIEVGKVKAIRRIVNGMGYMNVTYVVNENNFYSIIQYIPQEKYRSIYTGYYDSILESFEFIN